MAHPKFGDAGGRMMKYLIGIAAIVGALFMAVPGGIIFWMGLRSVWRSVACSTSAQQVLVEVMHWEGLEEAFPGSSKARYS